MKVEVNISLKEGVLDPEGQAIDNTLRNLGYSNFDNIRTGKQIILNIDKKIDLYFFKHHIAMYLKYCSCAVVWKK